MVNDPLPDPSMDPYDAPSVEQASQPVMRLGAEFWVPIVLSLTISGASVAVLFLPGNQTGYYAFAMLFGLFGSLTTFMAMARGFVWQSRLPFLDKSQQDRDGFGLFISSTLLGFCATIISTLCCVVICVPMGFVLIDSRSSGTDGTSSLIFLSIVCICLGLFVGTLFVRWTVPKVPME